MLLVLGWLALAGALLILAGRPLGVLELLVVAAAAAVALADDRWPSWLIFAAAAATYLGVAGLGDQLGRDAYWGHVGLLACLGGAILGAASARRVRQESDDDRRLLREQLDERRVTERLDRLLAAERSLDGIERELLRSQRHDHATSVLIVHPDQVADVKARSGRLGVESLLAATAEAIGVSVRSTDLGRSDSGDEFELLLPETDAIGARVAAERIRLAIARRAVASPSDEPFDSTVSIGIAAFPSDGQDRESLLAAARGALAEAIALGGNRTILAAVPDSAPPGWGTRHGASSEHP